MTDNMKPDITTVMPSKTGMTVVMHNLLMTGILIGDGWEWDMVGYLSIGDDDDYDFVAVSLAIKGFKEVIETKLTRGNVISVRGTFGEFETSSSGKERFRRIFCDAKDIKILRRASSEFWGLK
jgi:nucleoid DNA-binding protein